MNKENQNILIGSGLLLTLLFLIFKKKKKPTVSNTLVNKNIMQKFEKSNQDIINNLHPKEKQQFINFINDIKNMGFAVVLTSGYRSFLKQSQLKKENAKNASPGFSSHNYGLAIDLNLIKNGIWVNMNTPQKIWIETGVIKLAKDKYKFRWGGDFPGYEDNVHFDLMNKYDINKLYTQALNKFGSIEKIEGNKLLI